MIRKCIIVGISLAAVLGSGLGAVALDTGPRNGYAVTTADRIGNPIGVNKFIRAWGGIPPCTHEDGAGQPKPCYWNAQEQGNGTGRSYVIMPGGEDGRVVYLTR